MAGSRKISEAQFLSMADAVPPEDMLRVLMEVNKDITYEELADSLGVSEYEIRRELGLF